MAKSVLNHINSRFDMLVHATIMKLSLHVYKEQGLLKMDGALTMRLKLHQLKIRRHAFCGIPSFKYGRVFLITYLQEIVAITFTPNSDVSYIG